MEFRNPGVLENMMTAVLIGLMAGTFVLVGSQTWLWGILGAIAAYSGIGSLVFLGLAILQGEINERNKTRRAA
jgi:hypothetical protein